MGRVRDSSREGQADSLLRPALTMLPFDDPYGERGDELAKRFRFPKRPDSGEEPIEDLLGDVVDLVHFDQDLETHDAPDHGGETQPASLSAPSCPATGGRARGSTSSTPSGALMGCSLSGHVGRRERDAAVAAAGLDEDAGLQHVPQRHSPWAFQAVEVLG